MACLQHACAPGGRLAWWPCEHVHHMLGACTHPSAIVLCDLSVGAEPTACVQHGLPSVRHNGSMRHRGGTARPPSNGLPGNAAEANGGVGGAPLSIDPDAESPTHQQRGPLHSGSAGAGLVTALSCRADSTVRRLLKQRMRICCCRPALQEGALPVLCSIGAAFTAPRLMKFASLTAVIFLCTTCVQSMMLRMLSTQCCVQQDDDDACCRCCCAALQHAEHARHVRGTCGCCASELASQLLCSAQRCCCGSAAGDALQQASERECCWEIFDRRPTCAMNVWAVQDRGATLPRNRWLA